MPDETEDTTEHTHEPIDGHRPDDAVPYEADEVGADHSPSDEGRRR